MKVLVVTPRYARDYKNEAEARAAWDAGKDFTAWPVGLAVSTGDMAFIKADGFERVRIRFNNAADFVEFDL